MTTHIGMKFCSERSQKFDPEHHGEFLTVEVKSSTVSGNGPNARYIYECQGASPWPGRTSFATSKGDVLVFES